MSEALMIRPTTITNQQIAEALHEVADLLHCQGAMGLRVTTYRDAAETIRRMHEAVCEILDREGTDGLMTLKDVGRGLAKHIKELADTGHMPLLDRLRGDYCAERMFTTVPDIGPELAHRIHEHLHVENLFELKAAADDGRLSSVPGMGTKRVRAVRESLAGRFHTLPPAPETPTDAYSRVDAVPVAEVLEVDAEFRQLAEDGKLPKVAPKQSNPTGAKWLPILHTQRNNRHYTALYSNTARAHRMGTTHDWVVVYRDDDGAQKRWTVITARYRKLKGKRIIPGRELECAEYYSSGQLKNGETK